MSSSYAKKLSASQWTGKFSDAQYSKTRTPVEYKDDFKNLRYNYKKSNGHKSQKLYGRRCYTLYTLQKIDVIDYTFYYVL